MNTEETSKLFHQAIDHFEHSCQQIDRCTEKKVKRARGFRLIHPWKLYRHCCDQQLDHSNSRENSKYAIETVYSLILLTEVIFVGLCLLSHYHNHLQHSLSYNNY